MGLRIIFLCLLFFVAGCASGISFSTSGDTVSAGLPGAPSEPFVHASAGGGLITSTNFAMYIVFSPTNLGQGIMGENYQMSDPLVEAAMDAVLSMGE